MAIWYILWSFGIFLPVLVFCTKKNLAALLWITATGGARVKKVAQSVAQHGFLPKTMRYFHREKK
jgi:hypothetical protein